MGNSDHGTTYTKCHVRSSPPTLFTHRGWGSERVQGAMITSCRVQGWSDREVERKKARGGWEGAEAREEESWGRVCV
jgi:hypothetical protein